MSCLDEAVETSGQSDSLVMSSVFSATALHTSHSDQGSNLLRMRGCFLGQSAPSLSASMVSLTALV